MNPPSVRDLASARRSDAGAIRLGERDTTLRDDNPAGDHPPATDTSPQRTHGQPGGKVSAQRPITYLGLRHHGPHR